MASLLSKFVNNLSERIHRIKSVMKYLKRGIKYKYGDFFLIHEF